MRERESARRERKRERTRVFKCVCMKLEVKDNPDKFSWSKRKISPTVLLFS